MATVVTVLRSGGEFGPEHVQAMQRQIRKWAPPGTEYICISDVPVPGVTIVPMKYDWPNWWCKLELFRPDLKGPFFFTDLDNIVIGKLDDILTADEFTLQWGGWTALMCLPEAMRHEVWDDFIKDPEGSMKEFARENQPTINGVGNYGDAGFISSRGFKRGTRYWEVLYPGQVVNIAYFNAPWPFRVQVSTGKSANVRIIMAGQPNRPWRLKDGRLRAAYWCEENSPALAPKREENI